MPIDDGQRLDRRTILKGVGGAASTAGLSALAGCVGGTGAGSQDDTGTGDSGSGTGTGGTGDVLYWSGSVEQGTPDSEYRDWYHSTYEENNPDAELTISGFTYPDRRQKFLTGARQGNPDYLEGVLSHLSEFQKADLLEPLTERVEGLDHWDGFTDGAKDAVTYDGEVWGVPITGNGRALLYRNDVFEELGLEPPETAEEFHAAGQTINEEKDDMWAFHNCTKDGGVRAFQEWMSHIYQHEDNLFTLNGDSWELVPAAETLGIVFDNWYAKVYTGDNPIANPDSLGTGWQVNDYGYLNGDYAMIECGPWILNMVSDDGVDNNDAASERMNENTTVKHLPHDGDANRGTYLEVKPMMINSHSPDKDLAWEGVKLGTSLESFRKRKEAGLSLATPLHTEISTTIDSENLAGFEDVIQTARPLAKIAWGSVRTAFFKEMQQVAYGEKEPMAAGESLHQKLTDVTSELTT